MAVQLFIPCYVDQFAPQVAQALADLLTNLNISWCYPAAQTCCGQFAFNAGDWPTARRLMRHFFQVFTDDDIIICPSASCVHTIRHLYPQLIETSTDAAHLQRLQSLVFDFTEWIISLLPLPFPLAWSGRIFLHQSCAARQLAILPHCRHLLNLIDHLQPLEISPTYSCCGFGGLFSLKCPDLSQAIGSNYLTAVLSTNPTALVSPDVGCLLHLQAMLPATRQTLPMYHVVELICQSIKTSEDAASPDSF
jgi:L-lactate dehydrogenase complex protein LldE